MKYDSCAQQANRRETFHRGELMNCVHVRRSALRFYALLAIAALLSFGAMPTREIKGSGFPVRVSTQTGMAGTLGSVVGAIPR